MWYPDKQIKIYRSTPKHGECVMKKKFLLNHLEQKLDNGIDRLVNQFSELTFIHYQYKLNYCSFTIFCFKGTKCYRGVGKSISSIRTEKNWFQTWNWVEYIIVPCKLKKKTLVTVITLLLLIFIFNNILSTPLLCITVMFITFFLF